MQYRSIMDAVGFASLFPFMGVDPPVSAANPTPALEPNPARMMSTAARLRWIFDTGKMEMRLTVRGLLGHEGKRCPKNAFIAANRKAILQDTLPRYGTIQP